MHVLLCWLCHVPAHDSLGFKNKSFVQLCNYQVSKSIVHEFKFGDIAIILILIGSLRCLKEVKTMDMIVFFLIFSNICCRYTLELPL